MTRFKGGNVYYLQAHLRIVTAFVIREMAARYGRSPGGYVWAFLEPGGYIALMSVLFRTIARVPPLGDSFILFYASGYLAFHMFRGMERYLTSSVSANRSLLAYPNVTAIDAVVGRFVLQGITVVVVSLIILEAAKTSSRLTYDLDWTPILEAVGWAFTLALGIALLNMVLFARFPLYQKVYEIATRPLMLLSGVFYLPGELPHPAREIILYNPVAHIIILFRSGFYGPHAADGFNLAYLGWLSAGAFVIGFATFTLWPVGRMRV